VDGRDGEPSTITFEFRDLIKRDVVLESANTVFNLRVASFHVDDGGMMYLIIICLISNITRHGSP
jgi:hypothetical protein